MLAVADREVEVGQRGRSPKRTEHVVEGQHGSALQNSPSYAGTEAFDEQDRQCRSAP